MTRKQFEHQEREKLRLARERELKLLADAERNADPRYVSAAAEFWLARWRGTRSSLLRTKPCLTVSPSQMGLPAANSAFSLST
jgi:hypothetical protein